MGMIFPGIPAGLVAAVQAARPATCLVETGTNKGNTAAWAATLFERVITIEKSDVYYEQARVRLAGLKNVEVRHGDSRSELEKVLPGLGESCIVWLDSHWCGKASAGVDEQCPVLGELEALRASRAPHLILIDDARLVLSPPPEPYNPADWPGISELCDAIRAVHPGNRVIVWSDIIAGVPEVFQGPVVKYIAEQNTAQEKAQQDAWAHPARTVLRSAIRRLTAGVRTSG